MAEKSQPAQIRLVLGGRWVQADYLKIVSNCLVAETVLFTSPQSDFYPWIRTMFQLGCSCLPGSNQLDWHVLIDQIIGGLLFSLSE